MQAACILLACVHACKQTREGRLALVAAAGDAPADEPAAAARVEGVPLEDMQQRQQQAERPSPERSRSADPWLAAERSLEREVEAGGGNTVASAAAAAAAQNHSSSSSSNSTGSPDALLRNRLQASSNKKACPKKNAIRGS
ncbi:hypothetical protein Efla_003130 [Eimeria flavescens]